MGLKSYGCVVVLPVLLAACVPAAPGGSGESSGTGGRAESGGTGGSSGSGGTSSGGTTGNATGGKSGGPGSGGGAGSAPSGTGGTGGGSAPTGNGGAGNTGGSGGGSPDVASPPDLPPEAPPPPPAIPPTGFTCPAGPFENPLPTNRVATLIKAMAGSLEGPVWVDEQKTLYFCVVAGVAGMGRIDKFVPATNMISTFVPNVDVAGLALTPQGKIAAASFDKRSITEFDPMTGKRTDVPGSSMYMGKPFDQTNDLVVRSDGNIYFTDTDYRQDGRPGQETTASYRLSPAGQVTRIAAGPEPNGIALSPDGRSLYISSTGGDPLRKFTLDDAGAIVGMPKTFSPASSDGMAVDCAGNLYISVAGTIRVIAPDGTVLGSITGLGTSTVSNAAFGGPDHKTLFITTASALYQITLNVPGFPS